MAQEIIEGLAHGLLIDGALTYPAKVLARYGLRFEFPNVATQMLRQVPQNRLGNSRLASA